MTVEELIEKLKEYDNDEEVQIAIQNVDDDGNDVRTDDINIYYNNSSKRVVLYG